MKPQALGGMSLQTFLSEYWQKQPLLIRNALNAINSPITAEELAGLACEKHIESRIIIQDGTDWQLMHGPFEENTFNNLPNSHWTLLVQAVDHWIPTAAQFIELFNFIPRWRIDDLMVSYACYGGGVGPHFDQYDVFLVQTHGQREWQVGHQYTEDAPMEENLPVKILKDFQPKDRWLLDAGDILYLPPGFGHNGIAKEDGCITCSVGFRAPSHTEILREYTDYIGDQLTEADRYSDPTLVAQNNTGEISDTAISQLQEILMHYANDEASIRDWFGRHITTPKYTQQEKSELKIDQQQIQNYLAANKSIYRNESSRFAYQTFEEKTYLYIDGECFDQFDIDEEFIKLLCNNINFQGTDFQINDKHLTLIETLLNKGALYFAEE